MNKINIETLGKMIVEYKDGKPFTSMIDPIQATRELAEKVNEIIDYLEQK